MEVTVSLRGSEAPPAGNVGTGRGLVSWRTAPGGDDAYDRAMSQSPPRSETLESVLTVLADSLPGLTNETCLQIYRDLTSYQGVVERETLESSVARNLDIALHALRVGRAPTSDTLVQADTTAQERYDVGVPVEEIILGFRVSISLIHERFIDLGLSLDLPVDAIIAGSRILWNVSDAFTTRVVTTYHDLEVNAALADAHRRAALVNDLLAGRWPSDPTVYSLDPQRRYAVVRCEVAADANPEAVRRHLETTGSLGTAHALVVVDDGVCIGMVAKRPDDLAVAIGIGPFVRPEEIPRSGRIAEQALRLAHRLGRSGIQGLEELGWRLAATPRTDVGRLYSDKFLAPMAHEGGFGQEMIDAVRAWLQHGLSIPRAADTLGVHVNTVRYRLRRYQDLTGCDLDDIDDIIGVAWAIELSVSEDPKL